MSSCSLQDRFIPIKFDCTEITLSEMDVPNHFKMNSAGLDLLQDGLSSRSLPGLRRWTSSR